MADDKTTTIESKRFFKKLTNGDYGLAKTYWIYGALVAFVANVLMRFIESPGLLLTVVVLQLIYNMVFLYRGVWNAANKYEGKVIWAILAKIAVVIGAITIVASFVSVISAF